MRAVCGVVAIESAMMTLVTEAPSTALTVIASRIAGKAMKASIRRMIGLSSARKKPAVGADQRAEDAGRDDDGQAPIVQRDARAVEHAREDVAAEMVGAEPVGRVRRAKAGADVAAQRVEGGDAGRRRGRRAGSARTSAPPIRKERLARRRASASRGRAAGRRGGSERLGAAHSQPHARIDDGVEDVDDEVHGEIDRGEEQQPALDHREVARQDRADDEAADAGDREHLLDAPPCRRAARRRRCRSR